MKISLLFALTLSAINLFAQPGSVDKTFGNSGRLIQTNPGVTNSIFTFNKIALQTDGKIIAAYSNTLNDGSLTVYRYTVNGILDSGFGTGTRLQFTAITNGKPNSIIKLLVQRDNKIIVIGSTYAPTNGVFLARFTPNGSIDSSFGTNGAFVYHRTNVTGISDAILLADGRILTSATEINKGGVGLPTIKFFLLRVNQNGTLDAQFGSNGVYYTPTNYYALAQQTNLQVVVGYASFQEPYGFYISRLMLDGSLDSKFGNNGTSFISANTTGTVLTHINNIAIQSSNKIVFLGDESGTDNANNNFTSVVIGRITANGKVDSSFYTQGLKPYFDIENSTNTGVKAIIQPDDKIVVGAYSIKNSQDTSLIIRLKGNGTNDKKFGNGGIARQSSSRGFDIQDIALASNGKIVTGGRAGVTGACLARYNGDNLISTFTHPANIKISGFIKNSAVLYPNPAKDIINISGFNRLNVNRKLVLQNLSGETLDLIETKQNIIRWNISNLKAGFYIINVFDGEVLQETVKFLKQ